MAPSADGGAQQAPLLSEDLYKHTVVADYVVKRHVKLFKDRFETYADPAAPDDHRTYALDAAARLVPSTKEGLRRKRRHLRPPGVGSMTALAALRGKGATLELVRTSARVAARPGLLQRQQRGLRIAACPLSVRPPAMTHLCLHGLPSC
jgi:hypothetical protein